MNSTLNTLNKKLNNSYKNGILDLKDVFILKMLNYYSTFENNNNYLLNELKNSNLVCNTRVRLPIYIDKENSENNDYGGQGSNNQSSNGVLTSILNDSTVYTSKEYILDNGILYDVYNFSIDDINYSDNITNDYDQLSISKSNLSDGFIKIDFTNDYVIYNEDSYWLTISKNDIDTISYYTSSETIYSHPLSIRTYTEYNGEMIASNTATLTIDRSNNGTGNLSATIGDNAILSNNRLETILTLDMFTTGLTPPYNDPEGDLIDAIRIDEISTANVGTFYLNNVEIVTGQIITREDLANDLFTHQGADINTIQSDAFNFSARDEGSQIWIK